jgi:putative membrane protein insertion efficiency factor
MIGALRHGLWIAGTPARVALIALIRVYRVTLSGLLGGHCRFYPSCSSYSEQAIQNVGAVSGLALAAWRVLRCSPLSRGGVDHPPLPSRPWKGPVYDGDIQSEPRTEPPSEAVA